MTGYGLEDLEIESQWGVEGGGAKFSALVQAGFGVNSASYTVGTGTFPGVKRPECSGDHPPLFSGEVKERIRV